MQIVRDYRDGTQNHGEEPWFDRVLVIWREDDATMSLRLMERFAHAPQSS